MASLATTAATTSLPVAMTTDDDLATSSPTAFHCLHYEDDYTPRLASGVHFFVVYAIVGLAAVLGNVAIVRVVAGGLVPINRRTFRYLTLLLGCYELLAALVLFSLLFVLGVGYRNRVHNSTLVSPGWLSEDENVYSQRSYSVYKLLISLRDVCIGNEVSTYCLLALDRLLAIAAPVSKRWNPRLLYCLSAGILAVTASAEFSVHIWIYATLSVAGGISDQDACAMLSFQRRFNALTKASLAAVYYVLSLGCYIGTGLLLVKRGRARTVSSYSNSYSEASRRQATMEQMAKPLLCLVVGNAVQFVCLMPMMLDNFGLFHLEITAYYLFYLNCAAVPCITLAFNKSIRDRVFSRACLRCCCCCSCCRCC